MKKQINFTFSKRKTTIIVISLLVLICLMFLLTPNYTSKIKNSINTLIEKIPNKSPEIFSKINSIRYISYSRKKTTSQTRSGLVESKNWELGQLVVFSNGLGLILNNVYKEEKKSHIRVIVNLTLINTTKKTQNGFELIWPTYWISVKDSKGNEFKGIGSIFTNNEGIWDKVNNLSQTSEKNWLPGEKLIGNMYFDIPKNSEKLVLELSYPEFISEGILYHYIVYSYPID